MKAAPRWPRLRVRTIWLTVALGALLAAWSVVLFRSWKVTEEAEARMLPPRTHATSKSATTPAPTTAGVELKRGPWGELEVTRITIAPPKGFAAKFKAWNSKVWYFRDANSPEKVDAILKDAGIDEAMRAAILKTCAPEPEVNGMIAKPEVATVVALKPEPREKLYRVLGREPRNHAQADTFRYLEDGVDEWLQSKALSPATIAMVRGMTYQRGNLVLFSDASQVISTLPDEAMHAELFRMLSRQSAVMARLRIGPNTDLKALADYWGQRGREEKVLPVLESMASVPGGCAIDIAQLLPRFARERLYTYPEPSNPDNVASPYNCHWSSMNFFNETPDDKFLDPVAVARELGLHYRQVNYDYQFGDVIFFENSEHGGIHSVVYLADDIVFSKNGGTITAPWKLAQLSNLVTYYESMGHLTLKAFRRDN